MGRYLIRRTATLLLTIIVVTTMVFLLVRLLPGDPTAAILGDYATQDSINALKHKLGLDVPLYAQYGHFMLEAFKGDLGRSLVDNRSIAEQIAHALPYTLQLAIASVLLSVVVGVPLGVFAATRVGSWIDRLCMFLALVGVSGPEFWYGLVALLIFTNWLGWYTILGTSLTSSSLESWKYLLLPAAVLAFGMVGLIARMTRSTMLEILGADFIRTAWAKGLAYSSVIFGHALRNAAIPIITVVGINMGRLLGGTVVTEIVFVRPGMGQLLIRSISDRDYPMTEGIVLVFAVSIVVVNLLVDLCYHFTDPRVRFQ